MQLHVQKYIQHRGPETNGRKGRSEWYPYSEHKKTAMVLDNILVIKNHGKDDDVILAY